MSHLVVINGHQSYPPTARVKSFQLCLYVYVQRSVISLSFGFGAILFLGLYGLTWDDLNMAGMI